MPRKSNKKATTDGAGAGAGGHTNSTTATSSMSTTTPTRTTTPTATTELLQDLQQRRTAIVSTLRQINQAQAQSDNRAALHALNNPTAGETGSDGLCRLLRLDDPSRGLTLDSIEQRRAWLGTNSIPSAPRATFLELLWGTFEDATLQILMVSALVSLAVGMYDDPAAGYVEGCAILAAIAIVSMVTALNDYQKETQFRELSQKSENQTDVVVLRGGLHWQIPARDIVVGDVVSVEAGDEIPCDGVILKCDACQVDESALTGEPVDIDKDVSNDPFLLSGCTVESGTAQMIAIAVGTESQWGKIKAHLDKEQEHTPLQEKLDDMAALIGYVGMAAAGGTFLAMMFIKIVLQPTYLQDVSIFSYALEAFIIGVTIVVVAVPEGLPLAVTISLAFSTKKMLADQNLIRHLAACETMGNATNICSDKTGTLTENRMTVVKGVFADTRCEGTVNRVPMMISQTALDLILDGIACCSTARVVQPSRGGTTSSAEDYDDGAELGDASSGSSNDPLVLAAATASGRPTIIGNKTEAALLLLAQSSWSYHDDTDKRRAEANFGKPGGSRMFPFNSTKKRMTVLVQKNGIPTAPAPVAAAPSSPGGGGGILGRGKKTEAAAAVKAASTSGGPDWTLFHKGAAEIVLQHCTSYLSIDGTELPLTEQKRKEFEAVIHEFAGQALRCVALTHRSNIQRVVDPLTVTADECESKLENDLCLDAIAAIMDPLREDVIDAVATCQRAGIFVRMVTGDNLDTAVAIAKQAGILTEDGISMLGEEFRKLTPAELDKILPRLQVLARSSPEDKHILVQRLNGALMPTNEEEWLAVHPGLDYMKDRDKKLPGYKGEWDASRGGVGEVVGVTGDGTNDGPALKAADVGLSMGLSGTDVAKKASDIIILDDKFSSIVNAVLWGRSVYDNIRKFLQFQLTVNVVALTITFLAAVVGYQPPLNAVMMLWVNLIMDTMGALALGTEPPRMELLDRRPYKRDASLISRPMWRNIICQAIYQLLLLVFLLNKGPKMFRCEDGSRHHFTIIFNAFVFCQVFNEFNAREIGDRFDPIRSLSQSPMFLMVIVFTVIAQWCIVEFGGDFTQTYPLSFQEWRITVGMGAFSLPVGFLMRLIPIEEDPATFAGITPKRDRVLSNRNLLTVLLAIVVPVFVAIVYQLYWEIDEFTASEKRFGRFND